MLSVWNPPIVPNPGRTGPSRAEACDQRRASPREPARPTRVDVPRPDAARPGRPRTRRFRLLPVLALLLGALSPFAAAPAVADVLVSNLGQTGLDDGVRPTRFARAQGFTTGTNSNGYTLESIEIRTRVETAALTSQQIAVIEAELWSSSSGKPGSKLADLTVPSSFPVGARNSTFSAPTGTRLTASTEYHVVVYTTAENLTTLLIDHNASDAEDSGAATGWSIANASSYFRNGSAAPTASSTWTAASDSMKIRVNGAELAAPTGLTVTPARGGLELSWTAPTGTVTGYDVHFTTATASTVPNDATATGDAATGWQADVRTAGTSPSETIEQRPAVLHRVRVRAKNTSGAGAWVVGTGTPLPLILPSSLTVTGGNRELRVSWTRVDGHFGNYLLDFTSATAVANDAAATGSDPAVAWVSTRATPSRSATSATITTRDASTLSNGVTYRVRLRTQSPDSAWVFGTGTPVDAAVPRNLRVTAGDALLTARWTAPASGDVGRYEVQIKLKSEANWPNTDTDVSSSSTSHTFTSLVNGSTYQVRVHTVLAGGDDISGWTTPVEGTPQAAQRSSNANLSGLTASSSTSASGSFTSLTLTPGFSAAGTSYTATVSNARTHAKLTPTVADTGKAMVTVQGTAVTSGSASDAIALNVSANTLTVRVTAEDGTTTKDYTVTVTRQAVGDGLSVEATPACGTTITDASVKLRTELVLTPAPGRTTPTEYTWITEPPDTDRFWLHYASLIGGGRTGVLSHSRFGELQQAYPGFIGFEFRLTNDHSTTARCTWDYDGTVATPTVRLSASPNPVTEGSSVTVTATLSAALQSSVTIPVTLTDGSAEPTDHGSLTSITINAGSTSGTGTITTSQDTDTADETFTVALNTANLPSSVTAGTPSSVQVTISDDDGGGTTPTTPSVSLSVSPRTVTEGSSVTVTVRLSSSLSSNVRIPITLTDGTAEGSDYGSLSGITISSGSTSASGTITTSHDAGTNDETFTVALGNLPSSVTAGSPRSVTVTIDDDDDQPTTTTPTVSLSAAPNPVTEGSSVTVTARLSAAVSGGVTIPLTLSNGTAEDGDYGSLSSITINSGSTSGTGTITTSEDPDTDDETFTVALGNLPTTVTAGSPRSVTVRINDDDGGTTPTTPTVSLSASPSSVDEGDTVTVTATLSSALSSSVTIPLTLSHGTAEDGDYGSLSSITISSGSRTGTGTISTNEDADTEDETFTVALGSLPGSVTAGSPPSVEVTIKDDDDPPTALALDADPDSATEGDGDVTVRATLDEPAPATGTTVTMTTRGTATMGTDYTVTSSSITIGEGETEGTTTITIVDDAEEEDTETIMLYAESEDPALTATMITVTIEDNDGGSVATAPTVTLSAAPNPVTEGSPVTVTATLSAALGSNVTIPLTLTAGTAEAGDYGALESIAVSSGETTGTGTVTTTADTDTDDETFTVALGALPTSVTAGSRTSVEIRITEATLPSITLSAMPETVEEGGAATITATASEPVAVNTEVKLVRDGPTSTAGEPDFRFEPPQMGVITISASQTGGALRLTTIDDELIEDDESLTLNGLVGTRQIGAVTLTIEDNDEPEPEITYTLSGPEDRNLVEGKLYWITVTASAPVPETIEIEVKRDAAASTASDADFRIGSIRIIAGKDTGRRQLYVQADSDADGGSDGSTPETLVLFGRIGAHQFGELRFTLWDHTVPALPIGGTLLLGALLAWRGAVRARGRDAAAGGLDTR